MNISLHIAKRYLWSKSSNNAINIITYIALIGVVLGAASLFIVLSGFAGLKNFTLEFSSTVDPDLKAETVFGKSFYLSPSQAKALDTIPGIAFYSKIVEERAILDFNNKKQPVTIKGVDANFQHIIATDSVLEYGSWLTPKTNQIVVGWGVSNSLSMGILDYTKTLNIYVPKPGKGQITSLKNAFNTVKAINVGVYSINEKLDNSHVFTNIQLAQKLLNYKPNQISAIEFKLKNPTQEQPIKQNIQDILGDTVHIKNKAQLNDALYKMLNTENLVVYLIFTLVLIIAFFNVIGALIMMILDKKKSLNTLFNMGVTLKNIRKIFFYQGSLMSITGGFLGILIGLLLLVNQQSGFDIFKVYLTPTLTYPVAIRLENIIIVFLTISLLGTVASKIASTRITEHLIQTH